MFFKVRNLDFPDKVDSNEELNTLIKNTLNGDSFSPVYEIKDNVFESKYEMT